MRQVFKDGRDVWADSNKPNLNRNKAQRLTLQNAAAQPFLTFAQNIPEGSTISSAYLDVYAAGASTGSRTITANPVSAFWRPSQLTWNNKPGVGAALPTTAVTALADGDQIRITVTTYVQSVVNGAADYGLRLSTSAATAHKIYGFDSDYPPRLTVNYTPAPTVPTSLQPAGGAVATSKPTLTWDYLDADDADISKVSVQIDANMTGAVDFDSGWVNASVPELDLSATAYAGLTSGVTTNWRANVRNANTVDSGWSDWVPISYEPQGTLSIAAPSGSTVKDSTPDITWSLTGATQAKWQVQVYKTNRPDGWRYDTGVRTGTTTTHTLPSGTLIDESANYTVVVRTWDNKTRVDAAGFPAYVEATKAFTLADGSTGAPTAVTATADPVTPAVVVQWTSTIASGGTFSIIRNGSEIVKDLIDPADVLVSGTTYSYTDWTAKPRQTHTYAVRLTKPSTDQSPKSAAASVTPTPKGVWLVDPTTGVWITAMGDGGMDSWARADTYALYQPLGASKPVKVTSAMSGVNGSFAGSFWLNLDGSGRTVTAQRANLYTLAQRPDRVLRMIVGDLNIPVIVADLQANTDPNIQQALDRCLVRWSFWQYGELPFTMGA